MWAEHLKKDGFLSQSADINEVLCMNMNDIIARINELAAKAKQEVLSPEEIAERDRLRRLYIDSVKANLVGQLENTYIVYPDGTKKKVTKKDS